jgi:hypothetical protein
VPAKSARRLTLRDIGSSLWCPFAAKNPQAAGFDTIIQQAVPPVKTAIVAARRIFPAFIFFLPE